MTADMTGSDSCRRSDELASSILTRCEERGLFIAAAESLTGGLLADALVRIPGASHVFLGSAVTYDINAKAGVLDVDAGLLKSEGAVHPEVARAMAVGAAGLYTTLDRYRGHVIGLSTTGVAGPGPDGDKPAGLVYIGVAMPSGGDGHDVDAYELHLHGDRESIRRRTVEMVLERVAVALRLPNL